VPLINPQAPSVALFGDSIIHGNNVAPTIPVLLKNYPILVSDFAVNGQANSISFSTAQTQLAAKQYTFAVWKNWSPNDGTTVPAFQNDYDTYVAAFIALAQANGAIPIILTSIPCGGIHALTDDLSRQSINTQTLALASSSVLVADWDSALTTAPVAPPAWPQIPTGFTPDGVHPAANGQALLAPVLANVILNKWATL
jgi:hypothetical protein